MGETKRRWRPTPAGLISGALVGLGFGLSGVDWGFIALAGLGAFGPGVLRELGWLRDRDEFQLEAARRAGYHGFLAAGILLFVIVAQVERAATGDVTYAAGPIVMLVLGVMWFTGLLSSLFAYWGPRRTARRVLLIFGGVWLLFTVLSSIGEEEPGLALLMQSLIVLPFFGLAWLGGRWPKAAGIVLLACTVFFAHFFGLGRLVDDPLSHGRTVAMVLFLGPLASAGLAFLQRDPDDEPESPLPA